MSLYSIGRLRRPSSVVHTLQTSSRPFSGPIKAKFHMEPQWDGGTKVCSGVLGHMTKMFTTPVYRKTPLKSFLSGTKGQMILGLGMQHWGLGPNKVFFK